MLETSLVEAAATRYPELAESVELEKEKEHLIFRVESVGALPPQDIVSMACDVLREKADDFLAELDPDNT